MTIPGIGYINSEMILVKIGAIPRFTSPSKVLDFAGLDPSVYQSSNLEAKHTRMSKRGSIFAPINATHNVLKKQQNISGLP